MHLASAVKNISPIHRERNSECKTFQILFFTSLGGGGFGGDVSAVLTQGGETPGGAGVAAALATGFAAAALTHARSRDSTSG